MLTTKQVHYLTLLEVISPKEVVLPSSQGVSKFPGGILRGDSVSLPFSALSATRMLWLMAASAKHSKLLLLLSHLLLLIWLLLSSSTKDFCDFIRPIWIIQDNPLIS